MVNEIFISVRVRVGVRVKVSANLCNHHINKCRPLAIALKTRCYLPYTSLLRLARALNTWPDIGHAPLNILLWC